MFWSKLCKSSWNCAWNLAFPVNISPIVWNMCENLHYESVYFKELHNQQEYYWPTICRTGAAVVSTITSCRYLAQCLVFHVNMYPTERTLLRHAIDRWTTHNPQSPDALCRSASAESVIFAISLRSLLQFNLTTKLFTPPPPLLTQYLGLKN